MRKYVILSITSSAFAIASPALSQTTSTSVDDVTHALNKQTEIVVTAQRRSESLQDVPISITALTGEDLSAAGVTSTDMLAQVTPGLYWGRSSTVNQPFIRGVGSRNASAGDESNVATFIDGVYQPEQSSTLVELSSIERVEILKGPQGTLFGRNATGGAINVITLSPDLDEVKANASVSYGRFDYMKGSAYLSVPMVSDKLGASISAVGYQDDGYFYNVYLDQTQGKRKGFASRAKLLMKPTDTFELQINGLYSYLYDAAITSVQPLDGNSIVKNYANNPLINSEGLPLSILIPGGKYEVSTSYIPYVRTKQYLADAHFSWDMGFATLGGLLSYGEVDGFYESYGDASPLAISRTQITQRAHSYNQELTLTSASDGPLTWLIGVQGFQGSSFYDPLVVGGRSTATGAPRTPFLFSYGQKTKAVAGFAEATYELTDGLFVTGGLRYTRDKKTAFNKTPVTAPASVGKATFTNLSPRAVIRYEFSPRANAYFSYSQGFKSGTFNAVTGAGTVTPARPEKIKAYEIGLKAEPLPRARINMAAFHYDYTNLQSQLVISDPNLPGQALTVLQNVRGAKIDGLEISANYQVSDYFSVNMGLSLLDARYDDFPNAADTIPRTVCPVPGVIPPCGNESVGPVDVTGNDLVRAPDFTLNVGGEYTIPVDPGRIVLNASAFFSSKYYFDVVNRAKQPSYEIVNGSISYLTEDERWKFTVFGQNLTNNYYLFAMLSLGNLDAASYAKPRWFGVSASFSY